MISHFRGVAVRVDAELVFGPSNCHQRKPNADLSANFQGVGFYLSKGEGEPGTKNEGLAERSPSLEMQSAR